jgi:RHH-type transcriptional regulator, rel operon repressor / antitoxin RelB
MQVHTMSSTLSIRLNPAIKTKLDKLAKSSKRSKSFLAAEAIAAYVEAESWQLSEIESGLKELNQDKRIDHAEVKDWLQSWGKKRERQPPQ